MALRIEQIGLPTESIRVVNPTKNLVVPYISVQFLNKNIRINEKDLLINIGKDGNLPKFKIDKVNQMLDDQGKECFGCIYLIENIQNNKKYVGYTTAEYIKYVQDHFINAINNRDLKKDKKGKYLYNAIRKYGVHNFKWRILGYCYSQTELCESEKEAIYFYRSFGSDGITRDSIYGYNCTPGGDGGNTGTSQRNKGKTYGEIYGDEKAKELKMKLSKSHIGQIPSPEAIAKGVETRRLSGGFIQSEEKKKKISETLMGHPVSQETIDKTIKTRRENNSYKQTEETKQKISETLMGHPVSQETIDKIVKTRKEKNNYKTGTNKDRFGEEKAEEISNKISKVLKGQPKKNKGKTNVEMYGSERAKEISDKKSKSIKLSKQNNKNKKVLQELDELINRV